MNTDEHLREIVVDKTDKYQLDGQIDNGQITDAQIDKWNFASGHD